MPRFAASQIPLVDRHRVANRSDRLTLFHVDAILTVDPYPEEAPTRVRLQLVTCKNKSVRWGDEFAYDLQLSSDGSPQVANVELASRIAQQLQRVLAVAGNHSIDPLTTSSEEAYRCMLHGDTLVGLGEESGLRRSLSCYRHALTYDPQFPDAQAGLAMSCVMLAQRGVADRVELVRQARSAAARALDADHNASTAHLALAALAWQHEFAPAKARQHFDLASGRLVHDWKLHHQLAMWHAFLGDHRTARGAIDRATALHAA